MSAVDVANPNYARDLGGLVLAMPLVRFYGIRFVTIEPGPSRYRTATSSRSRRALSMLAPSVP